MIFIRFKFLIIGSVIGLVVTGLNSSIPYPLQDTQARHGLRVFIDPDNGEFQRPEIMPESATPAGGLFAMARGMLGAPTPVEVPSRQANGGYSINLEHHYRPPRQGNNKNTGS